MLYSHNLKYRIPRISQNIPCSHSKSLPETKMRLTLTTIITAVMALSSSSAFQHSSSAQRRQPSQLCADPTGMTEYMAKAHEEKLLAVKQIEEQKNNEIQNLKKELKSLKSAPGALATANTAPAAPPAGMDISEMTKEQLAQRLFAYQQFMAKYIVDSQQQKVKAVAAAEAKVKQQFEEKLKLLSGSAEVATPAADSKINPAFEQRSAKVAAAAAAGKSRWGDMETKKVGATAVTINGNVNGVAAPPAALSAPVAVNVNFEKRNAMIAAAGKAGKSRWGEAEIAKASTGLTSLPGSARISVAVTPKTIPAPVPAPVPVPPEVEAADHGLRADGGVSGPSLAERVNFGADLVNAVETTAAAAQESSVVSSTSTPASSTSSTVNYDKRNAMVVAAGLAGKSRWGEMEIQKVQSMIASLPSSNGASNRPVTITVTPEIEAADHGLRADGGVGGPSLAQRVNLGAELVNK